MAKYQWTEEGKVDVCRMGGRRVGTVGMQDGRMFAHSTVARRSLGDTDPRYARRWVEKMAGEQERPDDAGEAP